MKTYKIGNIVLTEKDRLIAKKKFVFNFLQLLTENKIYYCTMENERFGIVCDNNQFVELDKDFEKFNSLFYSERIELNNKLKKVKVAQQ